MNIADDLVRAFNDGYEQGKAEIMSVLKTGKWIWDAEGYHCSECFFHAYGNTLECLDGTYKFCPNCGAKMEATDDN